MSPNPDHIIRTHVRIASLPYLFDSILQLAVGLLGHFSRNLLLYFFLGMGIMPNVNANSNLPRWSNLADTLFQHITMGLPNPFITSLAEDGDGFLWVGTQGGLARWDGYRFRIYLPDPQDPDSLPDIHIRTLHTDRLGRLWIGTNGGGLARYNSVQDRFVPVKLQKSGNAPISSIVDDGGDGFWIATDDGLAHLISSNDNKNEVAHFRHDDKDAWSLPSDRILALLRDTGGRLWVGTRNGMVIRDSKTGAFVALPMPIGLGAPPSIKSVAESENGKIWIGTSDHGIFIVDLNTLATKALQDPSGKVSSMNHDPILFIQEAVPGQVWIGTLSKGLLLVDSNTLEMRHLKHDNGTPTSMIDDSPHAIVRDRSGLIWVGSLRGLNRHDPSQGGVLTLSSGSSQADRLTDNNILAVTPMPDGSIWLGSPNQGLHIINPSANRIVQRKPPDNLTTGSVRTISRPYNNKVYLGTNRGLYQTNFSGGPIQGLELRPRDPGVQVNVLLQEGSILWIGGPDGLWFCNLNDPPPLKAKRVPGTEQLDSMTIGVLAQAPDGAIWIGTNNQGLFRLDTVASQLQLVPTEPANLNAMSSPNIASLLFDKKNRLWVGTLGGGINLLPDPSNIAKMQFRRISVAEGLPNSLVNKLLEDGQGNIWASTDAGIGKIDGNTLEVQALTQADGLALPGYWSNSGGKTLQGELLFGGVGGLTVILPERYQPWDYQAPVVVTHVQLNNKGQAASRFNYAPLANSFFADQSMSHKLFVHPDANSVTVEFSALDYSAPERNRYAYQLDGYDTEWTNADANHRIASYTNLAPGDYRLRLRGSNRNGIWAMQERVVPIRVLPAWYQTWWSRMLQFMLATAAIYGLIWGRTFLFRQRQYELETQVRERTAELHQKQIELVDANQGLNDAIVSARQANEALNEANTGLSLSVETLRQLGDIGREITANLNAEIVFESLYQYVGGLLAAPTMAIFRMNRAGTMLELAFGRENGQNLQQWSIHIDSPTSWAARAAREQQELAQNLDPQSEAPTHVQGTEKMLTALFAPLIVGQHVLGVMTVQTHQAHAYGERERLIFRTLSAYGAIALSNAQVLEALNDAQSQLVEQEKMASLGGLVAGIAHEINTPLGTALMAISGAANTWHKLQEATDSGGLSKSFLTASTEQGIEYTELALRTANRAAELIAVFKTISVTAETSQAEEIELANYFAEAATLVQASLEQLGCQLVIDVAPGLTVYIVTEALTEVLTRVFLNVRDHAFTDGRIGTLHVCANETEPGEVYISIRDDGHGIAEQHLPKVFDPFFSTRSGMEGHVGLGLHVAYNHVTQRLKGKISITSTLGKGTCVSIRLKKSPQGFAIDDMSKPETYAMRSQI